MRSQSDIDMDDVVRRLASAPAEVWDLPEAPPLSADFGFVPPSSAVTVERPHAGWLARLRAPLVLRPAVGFAAASLLLLAGLGSGLLVQRGDDAPNPYTGAQIQLESLPGFSGSSATAAMNPAKTAMALTVADLPALKPGEYYELWALNSPKDLAPVGTFRVSADGSATVAFDVGIDANRYAGLDISIERNDGNPAHSGKSVVRSALPA